MYAASRASTTTAASPFASSAALSPYFVGLSDGGEQRNDSGDKKASITAAADDDDGGNDGDALGGGVDVDTRSLFDNRRRFNVAVTRARSLLCVVGDARALDSDRHWSRWLQHCRQVGTLLGGSNDNNQNNNDYEDDDDDDDDGLSFETLGEGDKPLEFGRSQDDQVWRLEL